MRSFLFKKYFEKNADFDSYRFEEQPNKRVYMNVTKLVGVIFLAVYLIVTGLAMMSEVNLAPGISKLVDLLGVGAGVLILISIEKFSRK